MPEIIMENNCEPVTIKDGKLQPNSTIDLEMYSFDVHLLLSVLILVYLYDDCVGKVRLKRCP